MLGGLCSDCTGEDTLEAADLCELFDLWVPLDVTDSWDSFETSDTWESLEATDLLSLATSSVSSVTSLSSSISDCFLKVLASLSSSIGLSEYSSRDLRDSEPSLMEWSEVLVGERLDIAWSRSDISPMATSSLSLNLSFF